MKRSDLLRTVQANLRKLTKELVDEDNDAALLAMAAVSNMDALKERLDAVGLHEEEFTPAGEEQPS